MTAVNRINGDEDDNKFIKFRELQAFYDSLKADPSGAVQAKINSVFGNGFTDTGNSTNAAAGQI